MTNKKFSTLLTTGLFLIVLAFTLGCSLLASSTSISASAAEGLQLLSGFSMVGAGGCLWILLVMLSSLFREESPEE